MYRVSDDSVTHWSIENGLPNNNVRAFHEDSEGRLWIGTYGGGLVCYVDDSFIRISTAAGLFDDIVSVILEKDGIFWFTCNRGLFGVQKAQLVAFVEGNQSKIDCMYFGTEAGLRSNEFNGGIQPAGIIAQNGELVFPTMAGAAFFDPAKIPKLSQPFPTFSEYIVDGQSFSIPKDNQLTLPPTTKRWVMRFSIPSFTYPENIVREYQLEGFDETWHALSSSNSIEFTNLSPGTYTLYIRAYSLLDPSQTESYTEFKVNVLAPWWRQSRYILSAAVALIVLSVITVVSIRLNSIRRQRHFEQELALRTSELELNRMNLQTIIENTDDLIWAVDTEFRLISANQNYLIAYEKRNGHQLNPGDSIFEHTRPDTALFWRPLFERAIQGENVRIEVNGSKTGDFQSSEVIF